MIIKDKKNRFIHWLMLGVERYVLSKYNKISFINIPKIDAHVPTLFLMNHFSFNDGPLMHFICRKAFKKIFKAMVLEEQMVNFKALKYVGCFSVNKKSRSLVESLNYAASLLDNPQHMLGIFPQGGVFSLHLERVHFEQGLDRILKKKNSKVQVIFGVVLLDFLASFKPKANVYLTEYTGEEQADQMEEAYNVFYKSCKQLQKKQFSPPAHVVD